MQPWRGNKQTHVDLHQAIHNNTRQIQELQNRTSIDKPNVLAKEFQGILMHFVGGHMRTRHKYFIA